MPCLLDLPPDVRLRILSYVVEPEIRATSPLGFGRLHKDLRCDAVLYIGPQGLRDLHDANPAGCRGAFWPPLKELLVSKTFAEDMLDVFRRSCIIVGTWTSFLANRREELFAPIKKMIFRFPYLEQTWIMQPRFVLTSSACIYIFADVLLSTWRTSLGDVLDKSLSPRALLELEIHRPCHLKYSMTRAAVAAHGVGQSMQRARWRIVCALLELADTPDPPATPDDLLLGSLIMSDADDVDWEELEERFLREQQTTGPGFDDAAADALALVQ